MNRADVGTDLSGGLGHPGLRSDVDSLVMDHATGCQFDGGLL